MLVQVSCEPKLIASIKLVSDDGSTKEIDVRKGMYATFHYVSKGVPAKIFGRVVNVSLTPEFKPIKVNDIPDHLGYLCDPNFVNSGFLDARDKRFHDWHEHHHCCPPPKPHVHDVRNFIEIEGLGRDAGQRKRIDVYSILDIEVVYEDAKSVMTPNTPDKITLIRVNDGVLEYTTDGIDWVAVNGTSDLESIIANVSANSMAITGISTEVVQAKENAENANTVCNEINGKITEILERIAKLEANTDQPTE